MRTWETDAEIAADGSMRLLSPPPGWLKPGRQHVLLVMADNVAIPTGTVRALPRATPEMLALRKTALDDLQAMGGLGSVIPDPAVWQREIRGEHPLVGRD